MWIPSFLQDRQQRVVVNGSHSGWVHVDSGVPQGTVLGPLLFLLFIIDLPRNITSPVRLFADDCILYRTVEKPEDAEKLQQDLDTLRRWEKTWQMEFTADKCFVMKVDHSFNTSMIHLQIKAWQHNSPRNYQPYVLGRGYHERPEVESTCQQDHCVCKPKSGLPTP